MNSALSMIGMALRAGRLEVGEDCVGQACRETRCRLALLARDAGESAGRRFRRFAQEGRCLAVTLPFSKEELGRALGRGECAMAAVTDLGLAQAIAGKLAGADPEQYAGAADRLRLKADRAAQRRAKTAARRTQQGGRAPVTDRKKR